MIKGARVPERAYHIVLWVVSVVFAGFIVGLGDLVIGDMPRVERHAAASSGYDPGAAEPRPNPEVIAISRQVDAINDKAEIASLQLAQAKKASESGTAAFQAWIAARTATTNPAQDPEVLAHTRALEALKANERAAQEALDALETSKTGLETRKGALERQQAQADEAARPARERAQFWEDLRVFLLRLAICLPMLLVAAWLVLRKRKSDYWPLARGFVLAAVFVFFVELVPYLPSYGGYVRYIVGIALTFAAGHFLIKNMRAYLERRREVEAQAEEDRRKLVSHDEAFKKMAASVCPGCDRPIAKMDGAESNFCVHCGMTLFDHCHQCNTRKMAFFRYCLSCGSAAAPAQSG
ncbi:MAG: zinc ribbon domain-containing protein [Proteobacteria bacterium]|nr:zinc ribbon domain-containing protein [Pseudomonadota bacterium]